LKSIGSSIANLDEAVIELKGIKLTSCFDNTLGLTEKLIISSKNN